jgi:hypothetical protein
MSNDEVIDSIWKATEETITGETSEHDPNVHGCCGAGVDMVMKTSIS